PVNLYHPDTYLHTTLPICSLSSSLPFFFLLIPPPPRSTLFPYTTLFRSQCVGAALRGGAMDFSLTPEQQAFRQTVRAWLRDNIPDRKSTRLNSSHDQISYAVFCLKKKKKKYQNHDILRHIPSQTRLTTHS